MDGTCAELCVGVLERFSLDRSCVAQNDAIRSPRELSEQTSATCAMQRVAFERPAGFDALPRAQLVTALSESADKVLKRENRRATSDLKKPAPMGVQYESAG